MKHTYVTVNNIVSDLSRLIVAGTTFIIGMLILLFAIYTGFMLTAEKGEAAFSMGIAGVALILVGLFAFEAWGNKK
jgi:hypothetical protein